jgi:hypothetical protein
MPSPQKFSSCKDIFLLSSPDLTPGPSPNRRGVKTAAKCHAEGIVLRIKIPLSSKERGKRGEVKVIRNDIRMHL